MKIERVWAMPSKWTFTIKPIAKLLREEMDGGVWLDPMAGFNSPATVTNDINPDCPTTYHLDALTFLIEQPTAHYDGVLFDPPYSFEQAQRRYGLNMKCTKTYFQYIQRCKYELARITKPNGKAITLAWNSAGLRKKDNFKHYRILLLNTGAYHPDIIVTCQRKVQTTL